jgi:uncharacterized membrane-anchored protein
MKRLVILSFCLFATRLLFAQEIDSAQIILDSIESSLNYQSGEVKLENGIGSLNIPKGFKYLGSADAQMVLHDLWGNPDDPSTLGLIVPENAGVTGADSWAFIVTYDEMGFVKDDDADDIDYEELLGDMQEDTKSGNEARAKIGYEPIALVGWASEPFYDKEKKVLHWAKELKFGESEENTLNYNVRILGRKGVVVLNAVSSMSQLAEVKNNIDPIMASFSFADGNKYEEFDPKIDEVAAWTIGGLVAGKILAKAGILALLLKNIKLIGLGVVAAATAVWKWIKRRGEPPVVRDLTDGDQKSS